MSTGNTLGFTVSGRLVPLARADDRNVVAARGEAVDEATKRHGDAVYFGSVSFSDEGKIQVLECPVGGRTSRRASPECPEIVSEP